MFTNFAHNYGGGPGEFGELYRIYSSLLSSVDNWICHWSRVTLKYLYSIVTHLLDIIYKLL